MTIQSRVTIMDMCNAVRDVLGQAPSVLTAQTYDEITEAIPDTPLLQVTFSTSTVDSAHDVDRTTFGAGVRHSTYELLVSVYAQQRSDLSENLKVQHLVLDELEAQLEAQDSCQPFGIVGCKGFRWTTTRGLIQYENGNEYAGGEIALTLIFH